MLRSLYPEDGAPFFFLLYSFLRLLQGESRFPSLPTIPIFLKSQYISFTAYITRSVNQLGVVKVTTDDPTLPVHELWPLWPEHNEASD